MQILIHGRKVGYNVLYPKPTPSVFFKFASDVQNISASNNSKYYGATLYSISFVEEGCIISKYIIGFDSGRGAIGNVGIAVFIPRDKHLPGIYAKELLDKLIDEYQSKYILNNAISNSMVEDWSAFDRIASAYDAKLVKSNDNEFFEHGTGSPAFLFYNSSSELEKYLNFPYQNKYVPFSQVYLLDKSYQGADNNPIQCLKHDSAADLTGKVDLDNIRVSLSYVQSGPKGVKTKVYAGSGLKSPNSKVNMNDVLTISWEKNCYQTKTVKGSLSELAKKYPEYISLNQDSRRVNISEPELLPEQKIVKFKAIDAVSNSPKENFQGFLLKNDFSPEETVDKNGEYNFVGDVLSRKWTVEAIVDEGYQSDKISFNPLKDTIVIVPVHEVYKVKFKVTCDDKLTSETFSIRYCGNLAGQAKEKEFLLSFKDKQIGKETDVIVTTQPRNGIQYKGSVRITPGKIDEICEIHLKKVKAQEILYTVLPGEHGKLNSTYNTTKSPDGGELAGKIIPDFGYTFTILEKKPNNILEAQYVKKPWFKFLPWAAIGLLVLLLAGGAYKLISVIGSSTYPKVSSAFLANARSYIQGDCMLIDTLKAYQDSLGMDKKISKTKEGKSLSNQLEDAIKVRSLIDSMKIENIDKDWSINQYVESICSTYRDDKDFVEQRIEDLNLKPYSNKSRNIKDLAEKLKKVGTNTSDEPLGDVSSTETQNGGHQEPVSSTPADTKSGAAPQTTGIVNTDDTQKKEGADKSVTDTPVTSGPKTGNGLADDETIEAFLKGDDLNQTKAKGYLNDTNNPQLKKSLQLVIDFWAFVKNANAKKDDCHNLYLKVKKDNNFAGSKLLQFLWDIDTSTDTFNNFEQAPNRGKTKLSQLKKSN